jgi:hypothetical protein
VRTTILCIEGFGTDEGAEGDEEGALKVRGRLFKNVTTTFKTPYESSDIGNYVCKGGLDDEVASVNFSQIVSKCFAFPLKMPSRCPVDPASSQQEWIMQAIRHSGMY